MKHTSTHSTSQRQLRIGEEIRHVLSDLFRRGQFRDPDLHEVSITVSEVRVTPDLRAATAFVLPLGGSNFDIVMAALKRATPYFRGQVAQAINLRHAPTLTFRPDTSFEYARRIDTLLHSPEVERDLKRPGGDADGDGGDDRHGA